MKHEIGNFNFNFRSVCINLLGLGLILLAFEFYISYPVRFPDNIYSRSLFLLAAVTAGFILRSIRRKLFFGKLITFHDSLSYEVVIQTKHAVNPLLPEKTFEAEFLHRETGLGEDIIGEWIKLRIISSYGVMLTALAWMLHVVNFNFPAEIICILLVVFLFSFVLVHHRKYFFRALLTIAGGLAIWAVEGSLFVVAFTHLNSFSFADAWLLYLFFTILFEMAPVPVGIGVAELPVLFFGMPEVLFLTIIFHFFRLMPQLFLGFVYLPRFKFNINDLFNSSLIPVLRYPSLSNNSTFKEKHDFDLSIVIPAYNEEKRLPVFLASILDFLRSFPLKCEVLVVDDGSTDKTSDVIKTFAEKMKELKLVSAGVNQGKGAAVRLGMLKARGDFIMFADADGATPINELDKFLPFIRSNCEVMIASRFSGTADDSDVSRKGFRAFLGMFFYKLVNLLAVPGIKDTQCGFKIFRKDIAEKILAHAEETGWAFDVEFLYIAQLFGCGIKEISVNWTEIEGSKVNPLKDSVKMLTAIFRIRSTHGGFLNDT